MQYAIVGAGKGAVAILHALECMEGYEAVLVCDVDVDAPGMTYARERGIRTTSEIADVGRGRNIELVFELTGNATVREKVKDALGADQRFVGADLAKIIWDLIEAHGSATVERSKSILKRIIEMSTSIGTIVGPIEKSEKSIGKLLSQSNLITINASIEAARLGHTGKAFAVIIGRLRELTQQVSSSLDLIKESSDKIRALADGVREMEKEIDAQLGG